MRGLAGVATLEALAGGSTEQKKEKEKQAECRKRMCSAKDSYSVTTGIKA